MSGSSARAKGPQIDTMRSQLGQVRGLGAAKSGAAIWWAERMTSLALVPLTIWFIISILTLLGAPRAAVMAWAGYPVNSVLLLALVIATFRHMAMGLQAVIEDYIHGEPAKLISLLAMKAVTILLGLAAVIAVLKLAF
jgi:succinate dehydrogenase / fumarate reductase, membrane anchor subunit